VVREPGAEVSPEDLRSHLEASMARWWLPEAFAFIEKIPKTSVGKLDKKELRRRLAAGALPVERVVKRPASPLVGG
jgi:fatty-acyl-CoA synthase